MIVIQKAITTHGKMAGAIHLFKHFYRQEMKKNSGNKDDVHIYLTPRNLISALIPLISYEAQKVSFHIFAIVVLVRFWELASKTKEKKNFGRTCRMEAEKGEALPVRVAVRVRPMNDREKHENAKVTVR
jgi:hypothetical protein